MKSCLTLWLFLLSSAAFADCEKIDYVEVKDWPVAKVEQVYCETYAKKWEVADSVNWMSGEMISPDGTATARFYEHRAAMNLCFAQLALYVRVLKNVHHKQVPFCRVPFGSSLEKKTTP
jgi:hypothetical protein